ncbi:MAG: four helix bundle protein, partial [Armatimonadetes bacterium]|nr:four helix bundle protein [Armatimonadota bacterium]
VVWQKAHQFVLAAYRFSRTFPRSETYGLASQFRRAAVSIADPKGPFHSRAK